VIICDTDVMVDILRGQPAALAWLAANSAETIALPGIVMMELIQGCRTKTEQQKMQKSLKSLPLLWPSHDACNLALNISPQRFQATAPAFWMPLSLKLPLKPVSHCILLIKNIIFPIPLCKQSNRIPGKSTNCLTPSIL
jgi:hypothetical protein